MRARTLGISGLRWYLAVALGCGRGVVDAIIWRGLVTREELEEGYEPHRVVSRYRGVRHCSQGPAVVFRNGDKEWWANGRCHRIDGPAIEFNDGSREWWVNGTRHRLNGPAIEWPNGAKMWYVDGVLHRLDGPAVEHINGFREWRAKGKRHRLDGPAVQWANGDTEWWVDGEELSSVDKKQTLPLRATTKSNRFS